MNGTRTHASESRIMSLCSHTPEGETGVGSSLKSGSICTGRFVHQKIGFQLPLIPVFTSASLLFQSEKKQLNKMFDCASEEPQVRGRLPRN
jgi:hypothetical protein